MDTTLDGLLNRRVMLEQPAQGYRVAVDTVLLAAAVDAKGGDNVLELGCGVGGAMLCLACRVPGISITGIEIQPQLVALCRLNISRNAFDAKMDVVQGDATQIFKDSIHYGERQDSLPLAGRVREGVVKLGVEFQNLKHTAQPHAPPPNLPREGGGIRPLLPETFDHVLMNPPYHDERRHDVSPDVIKRIANTEKDGDLEQWVASAAKALRPEGRITLIHRADRRDDILAHLSKYFSAVDILPILPKTNEPPRRMIFRASKGGQPSVRQCKNLVLHTTEGGYTDEAESILRHVKPIDFIE